MKRKQSEQRYQLIKQNRAECLNKQTIASVSINQQESDDAESDAQGDKEGKVEVGVQTDELLRTCKYGCDLIKDK